MVKVNDTVFTNITDLVDYVGRGFPPSKKNYKEFIDAVAHPASEGEEDLYENQIVVPQRIMFDVKPEQMTAILNEVYKNNCYNRNITIGSFFAGACIGFAVAVKVL